jgi:hypothetical protein
MALLEIRGKARRTEVARAGAEAGSYDTYISKLVKLIPAEVVAVYLTGLGLIPTPLPANQMIILPAWVFICLVFVFIVRTHVTKDANNKPDWKIVGFSAIAFLIWSYSMGGPWAAYNLYIPYLGGLLVLVWTFIAPYLYGEN